MRVDSLNPSEKEDYDNFIKVQRIRLGEIDTAWEGGKDEARKEFVPIIEEERRQKEVMINALKNTILNLQSLGMDSAQIGDITGKTQEEIKDILG